MWLWLRSGRPLVLSVQLLEQDWRAKAHAVKSLLACELKHRCDLFLRCTQLKRALDVPANPGRVHLRAGCIERDADQLDRLRIERARDGGRDRHSDHFLGPGWIELGERLPVGIPVACRRLAL